ncbi:hypothetical protein EKK97_14085 [Billgrantia tianxiuensis]|uniref:Tail fiber protein n=1 Tax=Billgrantia tianxiuensis TaxID=2497861 RepID=A0A6I6SPR4_9GAMM|nr:MULTISPECIES: hypothetical protein [Halomonas]MCE8034628.1 hypothetical protein [Halomonas sp. MCCC 1A11057]QHC50494.1 hypothetical protein EKK97_14085 [Halomonas tianxiuensis]
MAREPFNEEWANNPDPDQFEKPPAGTFASGWVGGAQGQLPEAKWENWWHNRVDAAMQQIERYGVMDWHAEAIYGIGGQARGSDGIYYKSISSQNTGNDPALDSGDNWIPRDATALNTPGQVSVTEINDGTIELTEARGRFLVLQGHGASNHEITGFGSACPIGWKITLYIPRSIANTGGTANALGNYVQFLHAASGAGLDLTLNARQDGASTLYTYQAYPDANDALGHRAALHEQLTFVHEGSGRWRLMRLPEPSWSQNSRGRIYRCASGRMVSHVIPSQFQVQRNNSLGGMYATPALNAQLPVAILSGQEIRQEWSIASASDDNYLFVLTNPQIGSTEGGNAEEMTLIVAGPVQQGNTRNYRPVGRIESRWKPNV